MPVKDFGTVEEAEGCVCWTVPGFADLSGRYYRSPAFSLGAVGGGGEWWMWMCPNGDRPEDEGHVSVRLVCARRGAVPPSSLSYKVSVLHDGHLTHTTPPTPGNKWLYKFIQRTELLNEPGLLCNGQLKVHIKVWPAEPSCHHQTQQSSQLRTDDPHSMIFKSWYQNTRFTDITVKVHDNEYRAHKLVLASRSPVFSTMLSQEMSESNTNSLDVTDMTSDGFEHLLEYMYTGSVTDLNNFAAELLNAAEKYELDGLKAMCVASLQKSISADTVLDTLILADLYRASNLKTTALEFIKRQGQAVTSSEGWEPFLAEHPDLAAEVVRYLLPSKTTK